MLHDYWEALQVVLMAFSFAGILAYLVAAVLLVVFGFMAIFGQPIAGTTRRQCVFIGFILVIVGTLLLPLVRFLVAWMFMWRDSL